MIGFKKIIFSFLPTSFLHYFATTLNVNFSGTSVVTLNPEMMCCYLSKRTQMRLVAKPLLSVSLFHSSSSPGDRFTTLSGSTDWKHCYYLYSVSLHSLLNKVCSQTKGKQKFACSIHLPVSLDGEIYKGGGNNRKRTDWEIKGWFLG